jgi:hypothetical protein
MAYKMQSSVPELADLSKSPREPSTSTVRTRAGPGTFAANCLLARRMAERGRPLSFSFSNVDGTSTTSCPNRSAGSQGHRPGLGRAGDGSQRARSFEGNARRLGRDFGRTVYCQGKLTADSYGRDHHPRLLHDMDGRRRRQTVGSVSARRTITATNIAKDPVHVHDLHATILHTLGIDHARLTYKFQGRAFRLTDVAGSVVKPILA